jgi:acyl carrier protein
MEKEIQNLLLDFISENFFVDREDIFLDESLIDQGIIDSSGLMEIASFIEENYSIVIEEEHMIIQNFGSIIQISKFTLNEINKKNKISNVA